MAPPGHCRCQAVQIPRCPHPSWLAPPAVGLDCPFVPFARSVAQGPLVNKLPACLECVDGLPSLLRGMDGEYLHLPHVQENKCTCRNCRMRKYIHSKWCVRVRVCVRACVVSERFVARRVRTARTGEPSLVMVLIQPRSKRTHSCSDLVPTPTRRCSNTAIRVPASALPILADLGSQLARIVVLETTR